MKLQERTFGTHCNINEIKEELESLIDRWLTREEALSKLPKPIQKDNELST